MRFKNIPNYILIILLGLISFAVYANSLGGDFLIDDAPGILHNPKIHNLKNYFIEHFNIRPGVFNEAKNALLWQICGSAPFYFHLFNILVHAVCVILLFWLCSILFNNKALSFLSCLIFTLHPIHTEAVSWISGGPYALASLFFLATFIFYIKSDKSLFYLVLAVMAFVLCFLTGNAVVALPFMLVVYDLFFNQAAKTKLRKVRLLALALFICLVALVVAMFFIARTDYMNKIFSIRGKNYLIVAFKALVYYLKILYLPLARGLYHPFAFNTADVQKISPALFLSIIIIIIAAFCFFRYKRTQAPISFGIAWFFITYAPYSNIIPVCNIISERYLYLPSVGFCIILAALFLKVWDFINRQAFKILRVLAIIAVTLYLCSYAFLTLKRNYEYNNIRSYWYSNINNFPDGYFVYNNLASTFYTFGQKNNATAYCWVLLMVNHNQPHVWYNLGNLYQEAGNFKEATSCYTEALKRDKNFSLAQKALDQINSNLPKK